jgi:PrtD family type I secretion system ABC transporter
MQLSSLAEGNKKENFLDVLKESLKTSALYLFVFSAVINIFMLIMPIYSLQVFDRVMSSGSIETLLSLSIIAYFLFIMYGVFNSVREFILIKLSSWIDKRISEKIFKLSINHSGLTGEKIGIQFFNDAQTVKGFVTSPTVFSAFDLPWAILFIFVIYLISPQMSILVIFGSVLLFVMTYIREFRNKNLVKETNDLNSVNMKKADEFVRFSETIDSMGMLKNVYDIWAKDNEIIKSRVEDTATFSSYLNSVGKSFRMLLQITITGYGTCLALQHEMTFGGIIACSTLASRAMAPFDAIMSVWTSLSNFREAYNRLYLFFEIAKERPNFMNLETPSGQISLEKTVFAKPGPFPGSVIPIIKNIDMEIEAGDVIGIIGPSASGKSTLVKLIAGIYKPYSGVVKIDGGDIFQRNREDIGKHIGYLSQTIDLLRGSIRDNISRFDPEAKDDDIISAAKKTGVHDLVLSLNEGYNTLIGDGKVELSGGQKQRVGLARAFYGDPKIIILDEPNANLDEVGERMLLQAIMIAKKEGKTIILISHKPAIINITTKIAVIKDGTLVDFGLTTEIMGKYARGSVNVGGS